MPKHVRVVNQYELCFVICFIEFCLVNTHGQLDFNVQRFIQLDIPLGVRIINRVKLVITALFIVFVATNSESKRLSSS